MSRLAELQRFLLHTLVVAGKNAPFAYAAMDRFLEPKPADKLPFDYVRSLVRTHTLGERVRVARMGNYTKLETAFTQIAQSKLDLTECNVSDLEAIHGIGCKTARFFLMYTRPERDTNDIAVIDTHTWKWVRNDPWCVKRLAAIGVTTIPPKPFTDSRRYKLVEQVICEYCRERGISSRHWDSQNWDKESKFRDDGRARISTVA
jgi:hypothetical protein